MMMTMMTPLESSLALVDATTPNLPITYRHPLQLPHNIPRMVDVSL